MTKKELRERTDGIRKRYASYKVGDLAAQLYLHEVSEADIDFIMAGGEGIGIKPYDRAQAWLAGAMNRLEARLPREMAVEIRQADACCLSGVRDKLARDIFKNNPDVDSRFEALSKERGIIGGKAWKEDGDYYITYWYEKPKSGYTCACLRCVPEKESMNKLWCECCAGHIKHHFETALGVKAKCQCVDSVLSSCGERACLFKLNTGDEKDV